MKVAKRSRQWLRQQQTQYKHQEHKISDNTTLNPGVGGDVVAADDVGGVKYQVVKLDAGGDGVSAPVTTATPLPVTLSATGPAVTAISLTNSSIGGIADVAATADTGSFSLNALIKRGLANWTTLLARIPSLVSGRIPVDGSGVTQPVAGIRPNDGTGTVAGTNHITVGGSDGSNLRPILTDNAGRQIVNVNGTVAVSGSVSVGNFPATQAVSISAMPSTPVTGTFWQPTQPVSAAALPLPTGAATESGNLATLVARTPAPVSTVPDNLAAASPIRMVGQDIWNCSFSDVGASIISSDFGTPVVGTNVTYAQASGNFSITTGIDVNSEFLARTVQSWRGSLRCRFSIVASQRIANQNFAVVLGDLIGEGLAVTVNSATAVTVTKTAHGYTSKNVGQFMFMGGIVGLATAIPGRYAIASVTDANNFVLTVAGFPASGSFTATLFGHSHVKTLFNGITATAAAWDTQRRGWAIGDTTLAINTTASPGTIVQNDLDGRGAYVADTLRANNTTPNVTMRGSRIENLPDDNLDLYLFLWNYNGSVAPATTTTWTISVVSVEKFANIPVYIQGQRAQGSQNPAPVAIQGTPSVNIGTGSIAAGTNAIGDVGIQYRANATGAATTFKFASAATVNNALILTGARRLLGWSLTNTTAAFKYFRFYNLAAAPASGASPTFMIGIPPNSTVVSPPIVGGIAMSLGLGIACTGAVADLDATVTAANDVVGTIHYV